MSDPSLAFQAVQDALDQAEHQLATLGSVEQLEQALVCLLTEPGNTPRALDPSPWQSKRNTRVRQANADAPPRLQGRLRSNFLHSEECAGYVNGAALALACLAGWEWAWKQLVAQHDSALFEHNNQFDT